MSGTIGGRFPEQYRKEFCNRHLVPGAVLRLFAPETHPPKIKRFIVLGFNDRAESAAILFINTEIPRSPFIKSLQFSVKASENPFITHDSFIDCSQLYERDLVSLRNAFANDLGIYLGELSAKDLKAIALVVRRAKTISPNLKRKYGLV